MDIAYRRLFVGTGSYNFYKLLLMLQLLTPLHVQESAKHISRSMKTKFSRFFSKIFIQLDNDPNDAIEVGH